MKGRREEARKEEEKEEGRKKEEGESGRKKKVKEMWETIEEKDP